MGRLFYQRADAIINKAVLDHFAIEVNPKRDIANPDKITAYAIKQALINAVGTRFPEASTEAIQQYVCVILCRVFHVDPQIIGELQLNKPSVILWGEIVEAIRKKIIWDFAGSSKSNDELYKLIVEQMLRELENRFFK